MLTHWPRLHASEQATTSKFDFVIWRAELPVANANYSMKRIDWFVSRLCSHRDSIPGPNGSFCSASRSMNKETCHHGSRKTGDLHLSGKDSNYHRLGVSHREGESHLKRSGMLVGNFCSATPSGGTKAWLKLLSTPKLVPKPAAYGIGSARFVIKASFCRETLHWQHQNVTV